MRVLGEFYTFYKKNTKSALLLASYNTLQNSFRRNWMLRQPLLYWLPKHPVFWSAFTPLTQSVRLPMVTYPSLCSPCVTYGTLCHTIGHQVLPTPVSVIPHRLLCHVAGTPLWLLRLEGLHLDYFWLPLPFFTFNPYLGKRRISLGVIGILSMYLRLHT